MAIKKELKTGEILVKGQYLQNKQGLTFVMQEDGNFVLYDNAKTMTPEHMLWQSRTIGKGLFVQLEKDGNLVIYDTHVTKIWESGTAHKSVNMLLLDGFMPQLVHATGSVADSTFKVEKVIYSFNANMNLFPRPLNAGVVLIGSLLWQDDGNKGEKLEKDLRKNWRLNTFESNSTGLRKVPVKFPIRYGRMSSSGNVYTMVVSSELNQSQQMGNAILLKVKFQLRSMQDVLQLAYSLAQAEGINGGEYVIKPKSNWAFISYALNLKKQIDEKTRNAIDNFWEPKASQKIVKNGKDCYEFFKMDTEKNSAINSSGRLNFLEEKWLEGYGSDQLLVDDLDFVLTTVTQPQLKDGDYSRYPNNYELYTNIWNDKTRFYFCNNYLNGIKTFQDKIILENSAWVFHDINLERGHFAATRFNFLYFNYLGQIQLIDLKTLKVLWTSPTYETGKCLRQGDDFNLAVYDASENQLWSADVYYTKDIPKGYSYVSCADKSLSVKNDILTLSIGKRYIFADDGSDDAVIPGLIWTSSPVFNKDNECKKGFSLKRGEFALFDSCKLCLSEAGELQLLNEQSEKIWFLEIDAKGELFCVDGADGSFTLYGVNNSVIWSTRDAAAGLKLRDYYFEKVMLEYNKFVVFYKRIFDGSIKKLYISHVFKNECTIPFKLNGNESAFFGKHELHFSQYSYACLHHPCGAIVWMSPDGVKGDRLEYQDDGNLVIYDGKDPKWSANVYAGKDSGQSSNKFTFKKYIEISDGVFQVVVTDRSYIASSGQRVAFSDLNWRALYFRDQCTMPFELHKKQFMVIDDYKIEFNDKGRMYITKFNSESHSDFCWESPKSGDSLRYQEDGNLVIYNGKDPVWSADVYEDKGLDDIKKSKGIDKFESKSSYKCLRAKDSKLYASIESRVVCYRTNGEIVIYELSPLYWHSP